MRGCRGPPSLPVEGCKTCYISRHLSARRVVTPLGAVAGGNAGGPQSQGRRRPRHESSSLTAEYYAVVCLCYHLRPPTGPAKGKEHLCRLTKDPFKCRGVASRSGPPAALLRLALVAIWK